MAFSFHSRELPVPDSVPVLSLTLSEMQDLLDELRSAARDLAIAVAFTESKGLPSVTVSADAVPEPLFSAMALHGLAYDALAYIKTRHSPRDAANRASVISGIRMRLGADADPGAVLAIVRQLDELARDDETDQDQDDGALILVDDGE